MPGQILHLAFDDTDSRGGRGTTHLAFQIVQHVKRRGGFFLDYPLLIRLNPNIPWKTRGNGAVCLRVVVEDSTDLIEYVRCAVQNGSAIGSGANPGLAFFCDEQAVPSLVQKFCISATHDVMSRQMAEKVARNSGIGYLTFGNGQGLVGALAALGCTLDGDHTYELIAYRRAENCGKIRVVDKAKVILLNRETYPETFCNYDVENDRVMIGPHGPDPVFVGIRGENPDVVFKAIGILEPEEKLEGWAIFRSNQGTNMHLQSELDLRTVKAYTSGFLRCEVTSKPVMMEGGHLFFSVAQHGTEMTAAVYEPTGLSAVASLLEPCDKIEIGCGIRKGTSKHPKVLNIEYLSVVKPAEVFDTANPVCTNCGKRMKSDGAGKGFKCLSCKFRDPLGSKIKVTRPRELRPGLYLPAIKAHRHLSKPLQRYGREKLRNSLAVSQDGLLHVCTNSCAHEKSSGYTSQKDDAQSVMVRGR